MLYVPSHGFDPVCGVWGVGDCLFPGPSSWGALSVAGQQPTISFATSGFIVTDRKPDIVMPRLRQRPRLRLRQRLLPAHGPAPLPLHLRLGVLQGSSSSNLELAKLFRLCHRVRLVVALDAVSGCQLEKSFRQPSSSIASRNGHAEPSTGVRQSHFAISTHPA